MHVTTPSMIDVVEELAHTSVAECYQCGKCTAGCPMAERMDVMPSQIMRLVQMERLDKAMKAESIWLCVSCQTCSTRCPKSVNVAGVIDALRQLSVEQNVASPAQQRTVVFQKAFLSNIRRNGRLKELELVGLFKLGAFVKDPSIAFLFKDSLLAPKMMTRGKFHLIGESVKDRDVVRRIFDRCMSSSDKKDKG